MKNLILTICAILVLFGCKGSQHEISIDAFKAKMAEDTNAQLLDVRPTEEYLAGHIQGAVNLSWEDCHFMDKAQALLDKEKTVLIYCKTGLRSQVLVEELNNAGYKAYKMAGGYTAWTEASLPMVKE